MQKFESELETEEKITPDIPGVYAIPIEENVVIVIAKIPEGISFSCDIGKCPTAKREQFFQSMMSANLFGQGTAGAVLGLSMDEQKVTLTQLIDRDISYEEFSDYLDDFINVVDFWRDEIEEIKNG
ncbi:MAG: type III secretion system chaperone [Chlamydiia bacterium]|nr:type III secretion system chaperone [Chlamydiia bacterium]